MRQTINVLLILTLLLTHAGVTAQQQDSIIKSKEKKKQGWTFGAVPAIAYDSDVGFRYGAIVNFFNFGDGSCYPNNDESIYLEWSRTTKGNGVNQVIYDSKTLLNGLRTVAECSYMTEKSLDFYGFNGYEAFYDHALEDKDNAAYISPLYYRMGRQYLRLRGDLQGPLSGNAWKWLAGATFYHIAIDMVDLAALNKGRTGSDKYPAVDGGLFGLYEDAGLLPSKELEGGQNYFLKTGIIYDTRDNEPNPMRGMWSDAQFIIGPPGLDNGDGFLRMSLSHRHYFTLIDKKLSLACRISAQNKLAGEIPFYMLPFVHFLTPYTDRDALGGIKTLRGILRNRVVGDGFAYANMEFRWKFLRTILWNQNIYLALTAFTDAGMVTQEYKLQNTTNAEAEYILQQSDTEKLHISSGLGFHFVLNENFIISADYGKAFDKRDGNSGLYIGIGFLY